MSSNYAAIRCSTNIHEYERIPAEEKEDENSFSFSTLTSPMNYTRLFNRHKSKLLVWLLILLLSYELISLTISSSTRERRSSYTDGFTQDEIDKALDQYERMKNDYKLTGIVLHWQRRAGVQNLVKTMLDYSDIFNEILIWNNNPKVNLTLADLSITDQRHIRIINSLENIKDLAKYRACEQARTNACFYVDDDWDIRFYARSLYSSFLLEPTILHSITDQYTYFTNLMWTFFDERIQLHTGFSWIGCGSIFSRENAIRHLKYLDTFLREDEYRNLIPQSDQFFSIWMNQIPAQFNGRLLHSDEGAMSSFENFDFETLQYRASVYAIEILVKYLRSSFRSNIFQRERASNRLVTLTKSPCSYNDRMIFFTNVMPIDHLEEIPFDFEKDAERSTRRNLPHLASSPYRAELRFFEEFPTANAVDNETKTCWKTNRTVRSGDFYGLDFHTIQSRGQLSFSIVYQHRRSLQKTLKISISLNGKDWALLPVAHLSKFAMIFRKKNVTFHSRYFPDHFRIFRFIRFTSLIDHDEQFKICEVYLVD